MISNYENILNIDMFKPVLNKEIIIDSYNNEWRQITITGYQRVCDKFFWPANPTIKIIV